LTGVIPKLLLDGDGADSMAACMLEEL